MLVNDVINSKSIALAVTEVASNQIPYLGLQFFPEMKKAGLDLKWIKTSKGLPVTLAPSNFDALPTIRSRQGIKIEKTQMAFFREQMLISEEDEQEIARVNDANDPYLASALQNVYDDANTLVEGAKVVAERMRMQLLATTNGSPMIGITSDGVNYAYNYDADGSYAANHYVKNTGNATWDNPTTATPLKDLNNARKKLAKLGKVAKYVVMNSNTFDLLAATTEVKNAILTQNIVATIVPTDDDVINAVKAKTKLTIVLYDKMFVADDGTQQYFYPDNKCTLLPEGSVGKTVFGTTPEERSASQIKDADVTIYGTGIAVTTQCKYDGFVKNSITASEIVLPSYEGMDSTFVIEVK